MTICLTSSPWYRQMYLEGLETVLQTDLNYTTYKRKREKKLGQ